jgi:hypothetical protein
VPKRRLELQAARGLRRSRPDANWFRAALAKRRIAARIPSKSNRKTAIPYSAVLYEQRHEIKNMLGCLKEDWRRIHTRA